MVILALFILGLIFGSFVNALVWRLYKQSRAKNKTEIRNLSIISGRSKCVDCSHELAAKDLIPLASWLWLRGQCRYCSRPISVQYPAVELATALLFAISYVYWPGFQIQPASAAEIINFGVWLAAITGFMALIVYDLRWMLLPNKIIFPLMAIGGLNILFQSALNPSFGYVTSSMWGILIGGGLFYLLFQVSDGRWIGGGDVKLGFLLGLLVGGPSMAFLMIFLASLLGSVYSIPLLIKGKLTARAKLPFGPFLIAGAIITKLFGQKIIDWYSGSFLL